MSTEVEVFIAPELIIAKLTPYDPETIAEFPDEVSEDDVSLGQTELRDLFRQALNEVVVAQYGPGWRVQYPEMVDPWESDSSCALIIAPGGGPNVDCGSRLRVPREALEQLPLYIPLRGAIDGITFTVTCPDEPYSSS